MEKKELTCISCPIGCLLNVEIENQKVIKVTGNSCKRGEDYGVKECTYPTRIVTSTIIVNGGTLALISVKTEKDIPKALVYKVIKALKNITINAPVKMGQVIIKDILGTGVNIIATSEVLSK